MKIAITGGSGFIGKRLIAKLEEDGHECIVIDLKHSDPVDILDLPKFSERIAGCSAIYHLAAEHADNVTPISRYYDVNVKGTKNVITAANENGINHIIFTSSFAVYGLNADFPDEDSPVAPFNDYGSSKLEAEGVLRKWALSREKSSAIIVRPVVVFGERNRGNVYNLINQIDRGRFLMIGKGKNRKSMAYVENVALFLRFCLVDEAQFEIYNYADQPDLTVRDLVKMIYQKLGKRQPKTVIPYWIGLLAGGVFDILSSISGIKFPVSAVRIKKFCAETTSNPMKARNKGFAPFYTLAEGFGRTINFDFKKK